MTQTFVYSAQSPWPVDDKPSCRHGYIQRWLLYNATTLYNICRFKSCISKKPTNIAVTKNVVTSIAIQHMLVKNCTPTFSYNILFNKVVIFCANQHQPYNNIFESCIVVYPKTTNTRSCCRVLPPNTTLIVGCCSVGSCCIYPCLPQTKRTTVCASH